MNRRLIWTTLAIGFAALNVWALAVDGIDGIVDYLAALTPIGMVASVDLLLALVVGLVLLWRHAAASRVDGRPFVVLTLLTGSLGLLAYLARHDAEPHDESSGLGEARLAPR
jgi:hypothetical protein